MAKQACNNVKCIKSQKCARHEAWLKGTKKKGCGKFIQKK